MTLRLVTWSAVALGALAPGFSQETGGAKAAKKEEPFSWVSPLPKADAGKKPLPRTVRHATFQSPSMGVAVGYYIYLPPGYEAGNHRYPVVYHLHGGRPGGESKTVRLAGYVDTAIAAGTIKPTIYVFPNGGPVSWAASCNNASSPGR